MRIVAWLRQTTAPPSSNVTVHWAVSEKPVEVGATAAVRCVGVGQPEDWYLEP
jgi:hypothetical protein